MLDRVWDILRLITNSKDACKNSMEIFLNFLCVCMFLIQYTFICKSLVEVFLHRGLCSAQRLWIALNKQINKKHESQGLSLYFLITLYTSVKVFGELC